MIDAVFTSLEREMERIDWASMTIQASVHAVRKTDDGRYAVFYRLARNASKKLRHKIYLTHHLHIATGYPATRITSAVQEFKRKNPNSALVHTAYEAHNSIYETISRSQKEEIVLVRGRGIVASRIIQRLSELRAINPQIKILHLMRTKLEDDKGSIWEKAQRSVFNHTEIQPFNWPKSCWGGELRQEIEEATPEKRALMFSKLGGTTTAKRSDWEDIIIDGSREGWYQVWFDDIKSLSENENRKQLPLGAKLFKNNNMIAVSALIDCTGLIGDIDNSPFLADLAKTYALDHNLALAHDGSLTRHVGIAVTPDFEAPKLRNGHGRVFLAGSITQGGPYAAVDSFLGLQYAALRAVDHLHELGVDIISSFSSIKSFQQWLKWCRNRAP